MDLKLYSNGHIYTTTTDPGDSNTERSVEKCIELPIIFERVATGPPGIIDAVIRRVELGEQSMDVSRHPDFYEFSRQNDSYKGDSIRMPLAFREDEHGNNILVLDFGIRTSNSEWERLPEHMPIRIEINFVFSNYVPLELIISGNLNRSTNKIEYSEIQRRRKARLIISNLLALGFITASLFLWNMYLNVDVYDQSNVFSQKAISAFMGALLAFLGLSFARIKAWIAALTDTIAVIKYPELHLNLSQYSGFASPTWSVIISVVLLVVGFLVHENWSVMLPSDPDWHVYDSKNQVVVENKRVYSRDLEEYVDDHRRFWAICSQENGMSQSAPIRLGFIEPYGGLDTLMVNVKYYKGYHFESFQNITENAIRWLKMSSISSPLAPDVEEALCNSEARRRVVGSGRTIDIKYPESDSRLISLEIRDNAIADSTRLYNLVERLKRSSFKSVGEHDIYVDRNVTHRSWVDTLRTSTNGVVTIELLKAFTLQFLTETQKGPKQAIERGIMMKALWDGLIESSDRDPEESDIAEICESVKVVLSRNQGWMFERVMMEFLLELQKISGVDSIIHRTITGGLPSFEAEDSKKRDYLVTAAMVGVLDIEDSHQFRYFQTEWANLDRRLGSEMDLLEYLVSRERAYRLGETIATDLKERLHSFKRRLDRQILA